MAFDLISWADIKQDALDYWHEPLKHYYVRSYILDDQVGDKHRFFWLRQARRFARTWHREMVEQFGDEVMTLVEMGFRGHIVMQLEYKDRFARAAEVATPLADEISKR